MCCLATSANGAFIINYPGGLGDPPASDATLLAWISGNGNPGYSGVTNAVGFDVGSLLYKQNNEVPGEEGTLAGSYTTTPLPWGSSTPEPVKITFGGTVYASPATAFVIKDGNNGTLIFDLSGWDGQEEIWLYNVFNYDPDGAGPLDPKTNLDGTSHFEFYGTGTEEIIPVPEPATVVAGALLLLPLGASAVRILRKNRAA